MSEAVTTNVRALFYDKGYRVEVDYITHGFDLVLTKKQLKTLKRQISTALEASK